MRSMASSLLASVLIAAGGADVIYVECRKPKQLPEQAEACNAAEIRAYPTWVLPDGRRKVGVQSLDALSRWSGLN